MNAAKPEKEVLGFQAEVKQLLQLMIHSLYSNKEIFLRELISNASDACDKLRFEALNDNEIYAGDGDLEIRISYDKEARTLTVSDNGVGMSREETVEHLGTIAKSGTREFFASLTGDAQKDAHLIGQFGVGFYSSFIVADQVTVVSRRAGLAIDQAVRWQSDGSGDFSVETVQKERRGTDVTLHLKEEESDLLSGWRLRSIIRKYSDHISLPIIMKAERWDQEKGEQAMTDDDETINQASAFWMRSKAEISDEDYRQFYQHVSHDFQDPLAWVHAHVEGRQSYTQLLYVPSHAPFDLFDRNVRHGVKLYVRRVFIMDDVEQLMPLYLRFVRGVVDAADLPLNISREILQESREIESIKAGCVKKILGLLEDMAAKEADKYAAFWKEFGRVIKEGVGEDMANKDKIAGLLRFASTVNESSEENVALADYVARMKEGQEKIYYLTAESYNAARNSPHLEIFRKKGIEVLLLTDRIDEWVVGFLPEFSGKSLQSVAKGDLDLGTLDDEAEKNEAKKVADEFKPLIERIQQSLGDKVKEVRVSHRLIDSPACLVAGEHDIGANMQRILKAYGQKAPDVKLVLEINPAHPLLARMIADETYFDEWTQLLYEQALLVEGGQLDDPAGFVRRTNLLLLA